MSAEGGTPTQTKVKKKRATMIVPVEIGEALRVWVEQNRRTRVDAVVTAFLEHGSMVAERFEVTEEDKMRVEAFGLQPLSAAATTRESAGDYQLTIQLPEKGLQMIDDAAEAISMSRQRFVSELLAAFLNA